MRSWIEKSIVIFQSTLSSQRVTVTPSGSHLYTTLFQSTLSSQRVTLSFFHVLMSSQFQSTLSSQRVTVYFRITTALHMISIHTLLAESDPIGTCFPSVRQSFQSTLSSQRVTFDFWKVYQVSVMISIHTLLAESDYDRFQ